MSSSVFPYPFTPRPIGLGRGPAILAIPATSTTSPVASLAHHPTSHGGYPWALEACLIAWKHPNVYLEMPAHKPIFYIARRRMGYAILGQTTIRNKIIYGTGAFPIRTAPTMNCVTRCARCRCGGKSGQDWLWRNAAHLLQHEK